MSTTNTEGVVRRTLRSRAARIGFVAAATGSAAALSVSMASAASTWDRQTVSSGQCSVTQRIWEGYNGSSHEYQQGVYSSGAGHTCYWSIVQLKNGAWNAETNGYVSNGANYFGPIWYDGPGYQVYECVYDETWNSGNACTSAY
jgi:hypothetical protein